jgi:hypothetical protein
MKDHKRSFRRLASLLVLTLTLMCSFAYFAPGNRLRPVAAQSTSLSGSFGFLIDSSFSSSSVNPTGLAILGVMNFDGTGNVTGPYTYEVDANRPQAAKTTTGTFTGTYSSNPAGAGSVTIALDDGITLTLAVVIADGGQSLQLLATNFQFPAMNCACSIGGVLLSGIARAAPAGSLNGSYGFQFSILPNASGSLGVAKFDGAGNVALSSTFVGSGDSSGQPTPAISLTLTGTYSSNPDGTGTINIAAVPGQSNSQTYAFVITDSGSGLLLIQTDRAGDGVQFGSARLQ